MGAALALRQPGAEAGAGRETAVAEARPAAVGLGGDPDQGLFEFFGTPEGQVWANLLGLTAR